jgi:hypothetical protein
VSGRDEDALWRKRLLAYSAVRLGGVAIVFMGVAIIYTNLLREGGWPRLGAIIALLGAVDTLLAPRLLKKLWDREQR